MKKRKSLAAALIMLAAFVIWTIAVARIDVQPIGPMESQVGFAALNGFFHEWTGVHWLLYLLTDWLSLVPACAGLAFAMLGLVQWIKRKHILKVDKSILILGVYYVLVFGVFVFFEYNVINRRPVLINGFLEASYPSSTTMLAACVLPVAMREFRRLIKRRYLSNTVNVLCGIFTAFMVLGRLACGVHWFTDVLGGLLFSTGMVLLYFGINNAL